jgi:hypothetical protein
MRNETNGLLKSKVRFGVVFDVHSRKKHLCGKNKMSKQISDQRKAAFYLGGAISVLGFLLFMSVFVTVAMNFGDFTDFQGQMISFTVRGIGGIVLMNIGGFLRMIGKRGLAGSGVILDPEQARDDLEPYSRMAGGMINDALQETDLGVGRRPKSVVKIKCQDCDALNDEHAKFCQQCGHQI